MAAVDRLHLNRCLFNFDLLEINNKRRFPVGSGSFVDAQY